MMKRTRLHHEHNLGDRTAGFIARHLGSWPFVIIQTCIVLMWIALNMVLLKQHPFDPFPFILLNLGFSTQAAYAAPILQMSANRLQKLDHKRDEIEAEEVEQLLAIQNTQLHILQDLQDSTKEIHKILKKQSQQEH